MHPIRDSVLMKKIVDKFLGIIASGKNVSVVKHNKRFYYIGYGKYMLVVAEDNAED